MRKMSFRIIIFYRMCGLKQGNFLDLWVKHFIVRMYDYKQVLEKKNFQEMVDQWDVVFG